MRRKKCYIHMHCMWERMHSVQSNLYHYCINTQWDVIKCKCGYCWVSTEKPHQLNATPEIPGYSAHVIFFWMYRMVSLSYILQYFAKHFPSIFYLCWLSCCSKNWDVIQNYLTLLIHNLQIHACTHRASLLMKCNQIDSVFSRSNELFCIHFFRLKLASMF